MLDLVRIFLLKLKIEYKNNFSCVGRGKLCSLHTQIDMAAVYLAIKLPNSYSLKNVK